jgi:uncharacterized membrane protein YkvA (DUF1232 family)
MGWEAWKRRARQLSVQTYTLYLAYRHPRTPWYAKAFAALIVGYVFSPIDPIPDFIPGVGLLDEMVVVPIGVLIAAVAGGFVYLMFQCYLRAPELSWVLGPLKLYRLLRFLPQPPQAGRPRPE